jgi:hypothetical protein
MKKSSFLLSGLLIVLIVGFISCKKEDINPQDNPPSVKLQVGAGYISGNQTVTVNDSLKFGIRATPNSSTSAKITTMTFARNFNGQNFTTDYNMPGNDVDLSTKANSQVGNETFTLTIKDEKGATASVQVILTTAAPGLSVQKSISTSFETAVISREDRLIVR